MKGFTGRIVYQKFELFIIIIARNIFLGTRQGCYQLCIHIIQGASGTTDCQFNPISLIWLKGIKT